MHPLRLPSFGLLPPSYCKPTAPIGSVESEQFLAHVYTECIRRRRAMESVSIACPFCLRQRCQPIEPKSRWRWPKSIPPPTIVNDSNCTDDIRRASGPVYELISVCIPAQGTEHRAAEHSSTGQRASSTGHASTGHRAPGTGPAHRNSWHPLSILFSPIRHPFRAT